MFSLFKSNLPKDLVYRVCLTKIAKYRQMMGFIADQLKSGGKVHLVAHFEQTFRELIQLLNKANIEYDEVESDGAKPLLVSRSEEIKNKNHIPKGAHILVVAEIYPMAVKEDNLKALYKNEMIIYCALDNPFFEYFGGDRIRKLMGRLNLRESEAIDHPMVRKSIVDAQKRLNRKAGLERPASSIREWMDLNVRR